MSDPFTESGALQPSAISGSEQIIPGPALNSDLVKRLTADGSNITDWAKYSTVSYPSPSGPFKVHFYWNEVTETAYYVQDYKSVFNAQHIAPLNGL